MFAELMYQYAKHMHTISENANFIIFNCAEYADNPQLLLSQLFGYVKGAFTGAVKEKAGMVEKADGGMLLLDEIHRLPPEGQEMLFLVMDKGIYRKLGETDSIRKANIMIVGATTEDTNSTLLKTFLRRVPMTIQLPSLEDRPIVERLKLIEQFFLDEAGNVGVPINVYKDVLVAGLLYNCPGNIGQLRADMQLLCARAFLEYKTRNKKMIQIETSMLPEHMFNGLLNYKHKREEIVEFLKTSSDYYVFNKPEGKCYLSIDEFSMYGNLYNEIIEKYNQLVQDGYPKEKVNEIINNDIEKYLARLLKKCKVEKEVPEKEKLFKLISPKVYYAVEDAILFAENGSSVRLEIDPG